ncbi:hypothetical protein ACFX1R_034149 [Malus domestica]
MDYFLNVFLTIAEVGFIGIQSIANVLYKRVYLSEYDKFAAGGFQVPTELEKVLASICVDMTKCAAGEHNFLEIEDGKRIGGSNSDHGPSSLSSRVSRLPLPGL